MLTPEKYIAVMEDLMRKEREYFDMTNPENSRGDIPEFEDGEEALAWMESRLNKSWVDDIFDPDSFFEAPGATS